MVVPITLIKVNNLLWSRMVKIASGGRGLWSHVTKDQAPKQTAQQDGKEIVFVDEDKWFQEG